MDTKVEEYNILKLKFKDKGNLSFFSKSSKSLWKAEYVRLKKDWILRK